jgi:hypothetical protein
MHRCPHDSCHHAAVACKLWPRANTFLGAWTGPRPLAHGIGGSIGTLLHAKYGASIYGVLYNTLICGRKSGEAEALSPRVPVNSGPRRLVIPSGGWAIRQPASRPAHLATCQSVRPRGHTLRGKISSGSTDRTCVHAAAAQGSDPGSRSQRPHPHRGLAEPLISRDPLDNEAGLQRGVKRKWPWEDDRHMCGIARIG